MERAKTFQLSRQPDPQSGHTHTPGCMRKRELLLIGIDSCVFALDNLSAFPPIDYDREDRDVGEGVACC